MADDLDFRQDDQQRQPDDENVVQRWQMRRAKRVYLVLRIAQRRRKKYLTKRTDNGLENILAKRAKLYGVDPADAPAQEQQRPKRKRRRRRF